MSFEEVEDLLKLENAISAKLSLCKSQEETIFFEEWYNIREKTGELLCDLAILQTASYFDAVIITNPVKKASFSHFLRQDVQSKTLKVQAKTRATSIRKGFIVAEDCPQELKASPLYFKVGEKTLKAVKSKQSEYVSSSPDVDDEPLMVCQYSDGLFVTSDVDIIMIASKKFGDNKVYFEEEFGSLTSAEKLVIVHANSYFQRLVEKCYPSQKSSSFNLFAHGPANRNPASMQSHLHFPMNAYFPSGQIYKIGSEEVRNESIIQFLDLCSLLKINGFNTNIHKNWST